MLYWSSIRQIKWADYCKRGISTYDDGIPKYTGLQMHYSGAGYTGIGTEPCGFLPDPMKSAKIVVRKTFVIMENPDILSSMERRHPPEIWSGGIRCSGGTDAAYAITGAPEIGDHLIVAAMMRECGFLSSPDWNSATRGSTNHMKAAREHVDMSFEQYILLNKIIDNIVADAAKSLRRYA